MPLFHRLKGLAIESGAAACGIIPAEGSETQVFSQTLSSYPQTLSYLKRGLESKKDIRTWYPECRSVLVCIYQYWHSSQDYKKILQGIKNPGEFLKATGHRPNPSLPVKEKFKISRYALSRDYHRVIKESLSNILEILKKDFPSLRGKIFADTSPVWEKNLAEKAGLGGIGRNTLLLNESFGSYLFIGGIALNEPFSGEKPVLAKIQCGNCRECEKACPTGALKDGKMNPLKCLSYWTTHSMELPPREIEEKRKEWFYGCDICQEVCPKNSKTVYSVMPEFKHK